MTPTTKMETKKTQQYLINYYNEHNILDYPKNKKGFPDMRNKFNKDMVKQLKIKEILLTNKQQNLHNYTTEKEGNYRNEIENLTDEEIEEIKNINKQSCIICGDSMKKNYAIIKCGHSFCTSCMVLHCRENNNCPMCRYEICVKPKKIIKINEHILHAIYNETMNNNIMYSHNSRTIVDPNNNYNFYDYLWYELFYNNMLINDNEIIDKNLIYQNTRIVYKNIISNLAKLNSDIANKIITYYESQL